MGSCGLHTVHNSFKAGVKKSGWNVSSFLSSLYYLYKDSPARHEDYRKVSSSTVLPLKFASHRWLENVPVTERALQILERIRMYVKAVRDETVTHPGNKSFEVVAESIDDPLIEAKLHFFKSVAMQLVPFLNKYQTDAPMVVFLGRDLYENLKCVLRRFIKENIIANAIHVSATQLISIDVENDSNHNCSRQIDVGVSL